MLINAYPESLRSVASSDGLPIHEACSGGRLDTVKYLLEELDPESIDIRTEHGLLPIRNHQIIITASA